MSSPTWMSGGSGSGVYDPVTTSDGFPQNGGEVRFSNEDQLWPSFKGGHKYSFGTYKKSGLKTFIDGVRNRSRPKCMLIVFAATVVLIMLVMIIALASNKGSPKAKPDYNQWVQKTIGKSW